jgi:hypothetical protein
MAEINSRFSIDDVYQDGIDIPHNPDDPVYVASEAGWPDIEWSKIDAPDNIQDALGTLGTQIHYINVAQVLLLGNVISGKTDINAKRLAILIAETRIRDVDAWGRYLSKVGETGDVASTMRNYFEKLHGDDNMVSTLIGVLLLDVLVTATYENLNGKDKTMERLIERNIGQAERNINLSDRYIDEWTDDLAADERDTAAARINRYITLKEQFITSHDAAFDTVGIKTRRLRDDFQDEANQFYDRLRTE